MESGFPNIQLPTKYKNSINEVNILIKEDLQRELSQERPTTDHEILKQAINQLADKKYQSLINTLKTTYNIKEISFIGYGTYGFVYHLIGLGDKHLVMKMQRDDNPYQSQGLNREKKDQQFFYKKLNEYKILQPTNSPIHQVYIPQIISHNNIPNNIIIMDYASGETLEQKINKYKNKNPKETIAVKPTYTDIKGIKYLNTKGIIDKITEQQFEAFFNFCKESNIDLEILDRNTKNYIIGPDGLSVIDFASNE